MRMEFCLSFVAALLAVATPTLAQTSVGSNIGAVISLTNTSGLDLPVIEPIFLGDRNSPPGPVDEGNDVADPRDEPPVILYGEELKCDGDTLFYVIDVSGSMGWDIQPFTTLGGKIESGDRMERAKAELERSISGLSRNFKFNIIAYDCGTTVWGNGMQQASEANKESAIGWVQSLQPLGGTGTGPAVSLALRDKSNMSVILLTDGIPNCGAEYVEGHRDMIRWSNSQRATISVFGIAASGSYRDFCQNIASDSGGAYFDVP